MDDSKKKRPDIPLYQPKKRGGANAASQSNYVDGEAAYSGGASREGSGEPNYDGGLRITRTYVNSKYHDNEEIVVTHGGYQRQGRNKKQQQQQSTRGYPDTYDLQVDAATARGERLMLQSRGPSRHAAAAAASASHKRGDYYEESTEYETPNAYYDYQQYYYEYEDYDYGGQQLYESEYYDDYEQPTSIGTNARRAYAVNTAPASHGTSARGRSQRGRAPVRGSAQRAPPAREDRVQERQTYAYARSASDYRPVANARTDRRKYSEMEDEQEPIRKPVPDAGFNRREQYNRRDMRNDRDPHARSEPPRSSSEREREAVPDVIAPAAGFKHDVTDRQSKFKRNEREPARNNQKPTPANIRDDDRRGDRNETPRNEAPQPRVNDTVKEPVRLPTQSQLTSMAGSTKGGLIVLPKEIDMSSLKLSPNETQPERSDRDRPAYSHRGREHTSHGDSQFAFGTHSSNNQSQSAGGRFVPPSGGKPVSVVRPNVVRGAGRSGGWSGPTSRNYTEHETPASTAVTNRTEHERRSPSPSHAQSIGSWADIIMMDEEDRRKRSDAAANPSQRDSEPWAPVPVAPLGGAAWGNQSMSMQMSTGYPPRQVAYNRAFQPPAAEYGQSQPPYGFHPNNNLQQSMQMPAYGAPPMEPKSRAAQLLDEAVSIEREIAEMIDAVRTHDGSPLLNDKFVSELHTLRAKVQSTLEQVILSDGEFCNNYNVEAHLWTAAYYQVIEPLRDLAKDAAAPSTVPLSTVAASRAISTRSRAIVLETCDNGLRFFESLLQRLESTHGLRFDDFGDPCRSSPRPRDRPTKLALYSAQKLMLFNGDLCRYREQLHEGGQPSGNFGKARTWYVKAQQLAPKNGRPYNQLAVLAMLTKRKLDALYFNVRALASSNPFLSARDCLKGLFDDVRKKTDAVLAQRAAEKRDRDSRRNAALEAKRRRAAAANAGSTASVSARREIWVHADGTSYERTLNEDMDDAESDEEEEEHERPANESLAEELKRLSGIELNKRFNMSFLNVHGKLFTKIGMDTFPEAASQTLHEFTALLQCSPLPLGSQRLLQLVLINIYAVENVLAVCNAQPQAGHIQAQQPNRRGPNQAYDAAPKAHVTRSTIVEDAVLFGLDMFAIMCKRVVALLTDSGPSDGPVAQNRMQRAADREKGGDSTAGEPPRRTSSVSMVGLFGEDVRQLLPAVKIWCDWMMVRPNLWNPAPLPRDPLLGPDVDVWQSVCDLVNALDKYVRQHCGGLLDGTGRSRPGNSAKIERWHDELVSRARTSSRDMTIVLPEDNFVAGFKFVEACEPDVAYIDPETADQYDSEVVMDVLRASKLKDFAEYLLGLEPVPFLDIDVLSETYVNVAPKHLHSEASLQTQARSVDLPPDAVREPRRSNSEADTKAPGWAALSEAAAGADPRLNELVERRNQLANSSATIEQSCSQLQRVIDANSQGNLVPDPRLTVRVEMRIYPAFLLADTNCYIDHLELIRRLLATQKYTILLPLIVLNELDGLSRGAPPARNWLFSVSVSRARRQMKSATVRTDTNEANAGARKRDVSTELADSSDDDADADGAAGSHAAYVRERARNAMAYLEDEVNERCNSKLHPVTQKGERLNDIRFRNEEILVKNMKNDELILETCLYRTNEKAQDYKERGGGPLSLFRDIVLLTNDRNLRLRAIAKNVPAKDIVAFVKWARIPDSIKTS